MAGAAAGVAAAYGFAAQPLTAHAEAPWQAEKGKGGDLTVRWLAGGGGMGGRLHRAWRQHDCCCRRRRLPRAAPLDQPPPSSALMSAILPLQPENRYERPAAAELWGGLPKEITVYQYEVG